MNIIFNKIYINGFMSFKEAKLDLDNNGYVIVTGVNNNTTDNAISNGSGKSSIWEAIIWALTGDTIRGAKDIVNHSTTEGCYVRIEFSVDGICYDLIRAKNSKEYKTNLIVKVNGEDKSGKGIRDSEKILKEYLPDLTASLLGSVIILGQGLPDKFSNNTPAGRKEILEKLSKSDFMIEDLKKKIASRKEELSLSIRKEEDTILSKSSERTVTDSGLDKSRFDLKNLESLDINKIQNEKITFEKQQEVLLNDKIVATTQLDTLQEFLETIMQELQTLQLERQEAAHSVEDTYKEQLNNISTQVASLSTEKNSIGKEIQKLEAVTDICPTCGQHLPDVHKIDTQPLHNSVIAIEKQLEELNLQTNDIKAKQEQELQLIEDQFRNRIDEMDSKQKNTVKQKLVAQGDITRINLEIEDNQNKIGNLDSHITRYETQQTILKRDIQTGEELLKKLDDEILYNKKSLDELQEHMSVISKFITIVSRDFRGFLITSVIEYINMKSKEYCKSVFGNDRIDFTLDGNNISIMFDGKEIESLSGGERQKVDLIIQFSLRDMLCKHIGFTTNILVLDEIFDNLDSKGCQQIINLISTTLSDVSSIYIVTHRGDLSIPYDSQIVVIKDENNISSLK